MGNHGTFKGANGSTLSIPMKQKTLFALFGLPDKAVDRPADGRIEVIDLFCGAGGFSTGAAAAGARILYASDCDEDALETHRKNHPEAIHSSEALPHNNIPFPTDGRAFHFHGSPPCQKFSSFNVGRNARRTEGDTEDMENMIWWFLDTALNCGATSWSMEEVANKKIVKIVEKFRLKHRDLVDYEEVDMHKLGVPQTRTRLIAGSPALIARLRRLCLTQPRRTVASVIAKPRGTHIKNTRHTKARVKRANPKPGEAKFTYTRAELSDGCHPINEPSPTVLANAYNSWITLEKGKAHSRSTVNPLESAALQTFPPTYIWPEKTEFALRQIGNAVPPLVAELMLRKGEGNGSSASNTSASPLPSPPAPTAPTAPTAPPAPPRPGKRSRSASPSLLLFPE